MNMACWDGTNWFPVTNGVSMDGAAPAAVSALAANGAEIYVGGRFRFAGGMPNSDFSIWRLPVRLRITLMDEALRISWPSLPGTSVLETAESLTSWRGATNDVATAGQEAVVTIPREARGFYRLRKP